MQKLLRKAAASLHAAGKFEKDLMHNYFMSGELPDLFPFPHIPSWFLIWWKWFGLVTEREVINGILNVKNTKNHCLAYVRYINNINLQNLKKASLFVDIINRSLDTESAKLLSNLRDERLPNKIESTNMQKYGWKLTWPRLWDWRLSMLSYFFLQIHGRVDWSGRIGHRNARRIFEQFHSAFLQEHR